jgi:hypothetical protein
VRTEDSVQVAQPYWRLARGIAAVPTHAGAIDLRFVPAPNAAPDDETLPGAPGAPPPPPPPTATLNAAAAAAAAAGEGVRLARRRRVVRELRWAPYDDPMRLVIDVGRFVPFDAKTTSWVTLHVDAGGASAAGALGPLLAVGRALGAARSACVWGALHACALHALNRGADADGDAAGAGLLFAPLTLTGARRRTGELCVRASVALSVPACCTLLRGRATDADGDALALILRHLAATRPMLAPPPAPPLRPPAPSSPAGFCGVAGCAAHRASAGAAVEAAMGDCFSLERLYADSVNDDANTPSAAPPPAGLTATLQPFQKSTLAWALAREQPPGLLPLHPLIRGLRLSDGRVLYWDDGLAASPTAAVAPRFGLAPPVGSPRDVRGGIIAEEMGLGKSVISIALILATKGVKPPIPDKHAEESSAAAAAENDEAAGQQGGAAAKRGGAKGGPSGAAGAAAAAPEWYLLSDAAVADEENAVAATLGLRRSGRRRVAGGGAGGAAAAHRIHMSPATLLVVPRPLLAQWLSELARHVAPGALRVHVFTKSDATPPEVLASSYDLVLTTFDVLAAQPCWQEANSTPPSPLLRVHWLRVMVDEAHALRNTAGAAARVCASLAAERRFAITGTPITAKLDDLYGLMSFIRVDPWCSQLAWSSGIVKPVEAQAEHGRDNLTALMKRICMRHTKASVTLPPRTTTHVALPLAPAEARAYDSLAARRRRPGFAAVLERPGGMGSYVNALRLAACGLPHRYDDSPLEAMAESLRVGLLAAGAPPSLADEAAASARRDAGLCAACGGTASAAQPRAVAPCAHAMCGACADSLLQAAAASGRPAAACPRCAAPFDEDALLIVPAGKDDADDADDGDDDADAAGGSAKVAHLLASLAKLPSSTRCLVFSQHRPLLSRVAAALAAKKLSFARFDGSGAAAARDAALASFRADASVRVLLLDTRLAACGLTLTEATHVFILDVPSSAGTLEQACARAHRIGQTRPVFVEILVAANTIEARLAQRHGRKLAGDGGGALRAADARALARRQMEWLLSEAPLGDDDDDDDDDAAAGGDAAGGGADEGDVVAMELPPPLAPGDKGKGKARAGGVKRECDSGGGAAGGAAEVISLMDEEYEGAVAAARTAKRRRGA